MLRSGHAPIEGGGPRSGTGRIVEAAAATPQRWTDPPETATEGAVENDPSPRVSPRWPLRAVLVGTDATTVAIGWIAGAPLVPPSLSWPPAMLLAVTVGLVLLSLAAHDLYRSRTCDMVAVEILAVTRAVAWVAVPASFAAVAALGPQLIRPTAVLAAVLWAAVLTGRGLFRAWLRARRRRGSNVRPLLLICGDDGGMDLADIVERDTSLGLQLVGVVGPPPRTSGQPLPHLGVLDDLPRILRESGVTGGLVDGGSLTGDEVNGVVRTMMAMDTHVHLAAGVSGIATRRLRTHPVAHEPLLHIAPAHRSLPYRAAKRAMDLVLGAVLFVLAIPLLLSAALAIRLEDGGPVVFRQTRVGMGGRPFGLYKLRTMSVDADERKADLADGNRRDGPLFKLADDPRVTRVGRALRASSVDELPQLLNVVRGQMSLVGPRPALPDEVAQFDDELRSRLTIKPGISGLWQVEARDDTSFAAYRRLDLYYVENPSLGLDLAILLLTVPAVLGRIARAAGRAVRGDAVPDQLVVLD